MNRRWTPEEAWEWWDKKEWIMGLNYVPSCMPGYSIWQEDTQEEAMKVVLPELDLMQEIGFNSVRMFFPMSWYVLDGDAYLDKIDELMGELKKRGIGIMPVLGNDCLPFGRPADPSFKRPVGPEKFDLGYHSGHAVSPFTGEKERVGWTYWDEEEYRGLCIDWFNAMFRRFAKDPRVDIWDVWNEPGNSNRHGMSIPYLKQAFEIGRSYDPDAPLTAGCWDYPEGYGVDLTKQIQEIERVAIDLSDIISFHQYSNFTNVQNTIKMLERENRPMANTEWLHRIFDNFIQDQLPLYYEKKIGSYHWGLVAGNSQHFLPWEDIRGNHNLDYTRWQHDIIRHDGKTPYDPEEIELFKKYGAAKDKAGNGPQARP